MKLESSVHTMLKIPCKLLWNVLLYFSMLNYWWALLICLVHGYWSTHNMLFCLEMFLLRVVNVFGGFEHFWSVHSLFCLEMLLQRVVNVFGGFERLLKHAYAFRSWNILAESCECFWWFWMFFEACIPFSVLKCLCRELWTFLVVLNVLWGMHTLFYTEMSCGRMMQPNISVYSVYTLNLTLVIPNYSKARRFLQLLSSSTAEHKNNQWTASP